MSKKIFAVLAAVLMLFAAIGPVYAEGNDSPGNKPAPEIVPVTDDNGNPAVAIIRDTSGSVVHYVPMGELLITAYRDREAAGGDIEETLNAAYGQLCGEPLASVCPEIPSYLNANAPTIAPDTLVARDLFDARLTGGSAGWLNNGRVIEITFDANLTANTFLMVMTNTNVCGNGSWDLIPVSRIQHNYNNTVTIAFKYLCPIVFITSTTAVNPPTCTLLGDYNCDNCVDVSDAVSTLRASMHILVPSLQSFLNTDIDMDGQLTIQDAVNVLRIALGLYENLNINK